MVKAESWVVWKIFYIENKNNNKTHSTLFISACNELKGCLTIYQEMHTGSDSG